MIIGQESSLGYKSIKVCSRPEVCLKLVVLAKKSAKRSRFTFVLNYIKAGQVQRVTLDCQWGTGKRLLFPQYALSVFSSSTRILITFV